MSYPDKLYVIKMEAEGKDKDKDNIYDKNNEYFLAEVAPEDIEDDGEIAIYEFKKTVMKETKVVLKERDCIPATNNLK